MTLLHLYVRRTSIYSDLSFKIHLQSLIKQSCSFHSNDSLISLGIVDSYVSLLASKMGLSSMLIENNIIEFAITLEI